jgi:hypothetical protein
VRQRIQLDPRYSNRRLFADERGINIRTVSDVEHGRRDNYEPVTIAAIEVAYMLAPGSVWRTLAGGDLEPAPPPRGAAVPLSGVGGLTVSADLEVLAREAEILFPGDRVKQGIWMFPGDSSKQAIWRTEEPLKTKAEIFDVIDRKRGTAPPPAQGESAAG